LNHLVTVDETLSRDQRTIQEIKAKWFPASKEVQDTEVIRQVVGVCYFDKRWNFASRLPGKGLKLTAKYCITLLDKLKQQLVSKLKGKLSKGILYLQDSASPHEAVISK
jgi:hypothetical protein